MPDYFQLRINVWGITPDDTLGTGHTNVTLIRINSAASYGVTVTVHLISMLSPHPPFLQVSATAGTSVRSSIECTVTLNT
jgi:hypothetical protein